MNFSSLSCLWRVLHICHWLITVTTFAGEYKLWSSLLYTVFSIILLLFQNIPLGILFSDALKLCYSQRTKDQDSHSLNCQLNLQIFIRYYRLTTRVSRRLSDLNFFVNVTFICDYHSDILLFECCHIFKDVLAVLYFDDVRHYVDRTNSCVEFSVFISRRTLLLTFTEVSTVFPCYISHPSHRHWFRHLIIN